MDQQTQVNPNQIPTVTSPLVKPLDMGVVEQKGNRSESKGVNKMLFTLISLIVILLGVGSGWWIAGQGTDEKATSESETAMGTVATKGDEVMEEGIKDKELFPDSAEGEIQANDGSFTREGTHMLIRPGGADQTAYLTSSAVDLDKFIGKKVEIYGQTNTSDKAGWLLDVGYVRVME